MSGPGRRSAGILLYRRDRAAVEVLIGHMGGPFWARRDVGAWTIPKGEYGEDEEPEAAARREFAEELGMPVPDGAAMSLGDVRQSGGKIVTVWAVEGDLDPARVEAGTFELEWPRGSGRTQEFPELDRVEWCTVEAARGRLVVAQRVFLDRLVGELAG
ncbi:MULTISPECIES: NUDIX domain-containing protein [Prauserella salsuginis group]|uniref:NUDIX domain-containing protein n=1 Tax=Prauserella salsuginis TaxID=387889 RepID=A0ABW6GAJ3_9PSEU|nr:MULTISPECIES: NUDIX domain-containing protein [Prauserella salsuginis group]MCR3722920.1 putative NTP pyrophosphohydrolase, NUDIX family [Prauserella flava]MCR3737405.1 putative NTP pyrophosphohydrolase, NUDIX family [Prauserella salsuginis]